MTPMDLGTQPLDALMQELGLKNSDLVKHSNAQLSHKMVAKGRKGRRLSMNVKVKIMHALNACQKEKRYVLSDLFNYAK